MAKPTIKKPAPEPRLPAFKVETAIASFAVFLSLSALLAGAWFALRGSVVTAVQPDSVFFYRDAGAGAVLTAGVDTALVNSASGNYGDVVTRITMEVEGVGATNPTFEYEALVTPVFTEDAERQAANCPVTARCVRNDQFLAIEEPRRTLDVPGGASRSEYIGFLVHSSNCAVPGTCDGFTDFATAARALDRSQFLTIRFHYRLYSDGEKTATCRINLKLPGQTTYQPWLAAHLERTGWVVLPCER